MVPVYRPRAIVARDTIFVRGLVAALTHHLGLIRLRPRLYSAVIPIQDGGRLIGAAVGGCTRRGPPGRRTRNEPVIRVPPVYVQRRLSVRRLRLTPGARRPGESFR